MDDDDIRFSKFAVNERPFCAWEWDLDERTTEFLATVDPSYFEYIAEVHFAEMEGEHARLAAVALRTNYAHALESFLALLFACFQAPACVPGWLARYHLSDLRALVTKVSGRRPFHSKFELQFHSWEELASIVHGLPMDGEGEYAVWREELGHLWSCFAQDFLDEKQAVEYNSLKHGFRVSPGGFSLIIGREPELGVAPAPEAMRNMGGSRFGSSFFKAERVGKESASHFRIRRQSRNWIPENHYHGLRLLSVSMSNIVNFLKRAHGALPSDAPIQTPSEPKYYRSPWRLHVGPVSFDVDTRVDLEHIQEFTSEEILAIYEKQSGDRE